MVALDGGGVVGVGETRVAGVEENGVGGKRLGLGRAISDVLDDDDLALGCAGIGEGV